MISNEVPLKIGSLEQSVESCRSLEPRSKRELLRSLKKQNSKPTSNYFAYDTRFLFSLQSKFQFLVVT